VFPVVASTDVERIRQSQLGEASWRNAFHAGRLFVDGQLTNAACPRSAHRVPFAQRYSVLRSTNVYIYNLIRGVKLSQARIGLHVYYTPMSNETM